MPTPAAINIVLRFDVAASPLLRLMTVIQCFFFQWVACLRGSTVGHFPNVRSIRPLAPGTYWSTGIPKSDTIYIWYMPTGHDTTSTPRVCTISDTRYRASLQIVQQAVVLHEPGKAGLIVSSKTTPPCTSRGTTLRQHDTTQQASAIAQGQVQHKAYLRSSAGSHSPVLTELPDIRVPGFYAI